MVESQHVSRPGGEQILVIEHEGETYEVEKVSYQKDVDGELVDVEEYRLDENDEPVPVEVADEVERANGADVDDDRPDYEEAETCEECEQPVWNSEDHAADCSQYPDDQDDELDEPVV